ncbi:MAG: hypothetical protein VB046_05085 [Paludibacter sp.]|nr:hypothetical protein [Paludibacter sp.]
MSKNKDLEPKKTTPIINIITAKLPKELAMKIYNEYQSRFKEMIGILENSERFNSIGSDMDVLELLLSLSIFHKRVICNIEGLEKFTGTISHKIESEITIIIGDFKFTTEEQNKIKAVIINYNKLKEKFGILDEYFNYYETYEFLENMLRYKKSFDNESPEYPDYDEFDESLSKMKPYPNQSTNEDLPF